MRHHGDARLLTGPGLQNLNVVCASGQEETPASAAAETTEGGAAAAGGIGHFSLTVWLERVC